MYKTSCGASKALVTAFLFCCTANALHAQGDSPPDTQTPGTSADSLRVSGYNKTFAIASRTADANDDNYFLGLNRTRFKLTYLRPHLEVRVENDTELRFGDYIRTAQFKGETSAPRRQYWDMETTLADQNGHNIRNDMFRAYMKMSYENADIIFGRQRIVLGTGRMWSTVDMLNPLNPLQIERDEYVGVDAALTEYKLGALSRVSAVIAPDPARGATRWVSQYRRNFGGTDINFTAAHYWNDQLFGTDFATQLGGFGLHGELTYTAAFRGRNYSSAVFGVDYAFQNTFNISAETYQSNQPRLQRQADFFAEPLRFQTEPLGTRYLGLNMSYEFTPLLKAEGFYFFNQQDKSRAVSTTLTYSMTDNLQLQLGMQQFYGHDNTEFGRLHALYFVQSQWFF
ncbi:MAG: hypothetical protein JWM03_1130 [Rhodocyclales bacterium]|nr:hypothetical protein [Rhodocyclales bacterium]